MSAVVTESEFYRVELVFGPTKERPRRLKIDLARNSDDLYVGLSTSKYVPLAFGHARLSESMCYLEITEDDNLFLNCGGCWRVSRSEAQRITQVFGPHGLRTREAR